MWFYGMVLHPSNIESESPDSMPVHKLLVVATHEVVQLVAVIRDHFLRRGW